MFESDFVLIERLVTEINNLNSHTKALHYGEVNNNWCKQNHIGQFLKDFITTKKIPLIPPHDKLVTDLQSKTNIFNVFLCCQMYTVHLWKTTVHFQFTRCF